MKNIQTVNFKGAEIGVEVCCDFGMRSVVYQRQVAFVKVAGHMVPWTALPVDLRKQILEFIAN